MPYRLHILGISGTFMAGLAIIARQMGWVVTGSDFNTYPPMSDALKKHGIDVKMGYHASHLQPHPDIVLIGNVCQRGNEAVEYVLNEGIPYDSGPGWLSAHVLKDRRVLAVSGTHGKTTTTSLLAWILHCAGLNPGYLIGGVANNFEFTANLGEAPFFVIEADEYDSAFFDKRPKFLHYSPEVLTINNIEFDHADIFEDLSAIKKQFHFLIKTIPGKGIILHRQDDQAVQAVLSKGVWSQTSYFCGEDADWQVKLLNFDASRFEIYFKEKPGIVEWDLIGQHNIENALAALAASLHVGVRFEKAVDALNQFRGVKRRLEVTGRVNDITIYDDFAHHPTAIEKTLKALRVKMGNKPIVAVLQLASNTMKTGQHGHKKMAEALKNADRVIFLDPGNDSINLLEICEHIPVYHIYPDIDKIILDLKTTLKPHDSVVIMSNKNFSGLQEKLFNEIVSLQK